MMTMKKLSIVLAVLLVMPGSVFATTITEISLGSASGLITFRGMGVADPTDVGITLGGCGVVNCVLAGMAIGTGAVALPGNKPAPYTIKTPKSDVITASDPPGPPGQWTVNQAVPQDFAWGTNGSLLTGTFDLVSFFQAPGSTVGLFNDTGVFNMVVTGGSEASSFGGVNASIDLVLKFQSTTNVQTLLGTNRSIRSRLSSGEILASPEPATLILMGTGLLGIARVTRRRGRKASRLLRQS